MRLLYFVLLVAALLPSVYGHVRLYRTDISGAVNTAPIRNAPSATSDGAFSVNGPCGGTVVWGKNGAANVKAGDTIKLTIGYNGGHADARNVFRAAFVCGKPDNDAALRATTATMTNVPTQAEPSSNVANKHTFTITLPAPPTGIANADKCTVSVLDQRQWGGCIDLQYPATANPTQPATTTQAATTAQPGASTTAAAGGGSTTTKAATTTGTTTTTTTKAPPQTTAKFNGGYIIGLGCDSTAPGCCCIQGVMNAQLSNDKQTLTFRGEALRSNCPGDAKISQTIITTLQADGSYKSNEVMIRNEPFTAEVIAEKRQLIITNVADDKPATCSFTATKPPSPEDAENAACSRPTPTQVKDCLDSIPNLPACEDNRPPEFDLSKCCPTCKPTVLAPKPKCPLDDLPRCADGSTPLLSTVTGCPSCIQIQRKCTVDPKNITACPPGVRPQRGANDCPTCSPRPDDKCPPKARADCAKKIADGALPACEQGLDQSYIAEFDVDTCCRKCIPPADQDKPADGKKCTPDEVKQCMNKIPICEDGEKPAKNATRCCPTCKRAERDCRIQDVALCKRTTPVCAAGEVPANIPGECCQTCRPAPPKCTPACDNTTSICIRDVTPGSTLAQRLAAPGRCFPKRSIVARLDVTSLNGTVDEASVKGLIQEIIERFCELPVKKDLCGATEIARMDISVQIIAVNKVGSKTFARVRVGFATKARALQGLMRLQSEAEVTAADACWADDACTANTDSTEIFTSAFSDESSTGDVTVSDVQVEGNDQTTAPPTTTDAPTDPPIDDETTTRRPKSTSGASSVTLSFFSIVLSSLLFIVNRF